MFGNEATRFRAADFFAVVLPGSYLVFIASSGVIVSVASTSSFSARAALWCGERSPLLPCMTPALRDTWTLLVVALLFFSWLVGSVYRALPVDRADKLCWMIFHSGKPTVDSHPGMHHMRFPYPKLIEKYWKAAGASAEAPTLDAWKDIMPDTEGSATGDGLSQAAGEKKRDSPELASERDCTYDYWKTYLAEYSPDAYARNQVRETRTRFFAGMFWSSGSALGIQASCLTFWALMHFGVYDRYGLAALLCCLGGYVAGLIALRQSQLDSISRTGWARCRRTFRCSSALLLVALIPIAVLVPGPWRVVVLSEGGLSWALLGLFGERLRFVRASEMMDLCLSYCVLRAKLDEARRGIGSQLNSALEPAKDCHASHGAVP